MLRQLPARGWFVENPSYAAFFDALLDGRLALGQTVTQDALCAVLGTSLSPLRETLTLLEADGLISIRRRIGVTIFYPDVAFVRSTFQFRGMIEREAIRKVSRLAAPEWLRDLAAQHRWVMAAVAVADSPRDYELPVHELERDLHGGIVAALGNPLITDVHAKLLRKMYLLRLLNMDSVGPASTLQSLNEHLDIIACLGRAEPDSAADALDRHLQGVLHRLLAS